MPGTHGLFAQTITLVKYQCAGELVTDSRTNVPIRIPCAWSGLFPLEDPIPDSAVRTWFSCPLHGNGSVKVEVIDLSKLRGRKK